MCEELMFLIKHKSFEYATQTKSEKDQTEKNLDFPHHVGQL